MNHILSELDSRSWERELSRNPVVILPVGALEAHGPHLPLASDEIQAEATASQLAERINALVAPTISYGSCPGARRFPGTVSLSLATLEAYARGVLGEFGRMGVRRTLVLSGHSERGHMAALREAADETMREWPKNRIVVLSDYDFVYELRGSLAPANDGHAGLLETSRVLYLHKGLVKPQRPRGAYRGSPFVPGSPRPDEWPESVIGDPSSATPALGKKIQTHVLDRLAETVDSLLPIE
jgi:creatinine amidohydrolase